MGMDKVKMGFGWPNGQDRGDSWRAFHSRSKMAHDWPGLVEAMAGHSEGQRLRKGERMNGDARRWLSLVTRKSSAGRRRSTVALVRGGASGVEVELGSRPARWQGDIHDTGTRFARGF